MIRLLVCVAAALLPSAVLAIDNGLGLTPAMGYNTWNDFRCDGISAANIKLVADRMAELQLNRLGYEYLNIDDCWATSRNSSGGVVADPVAFPEGMKAVADYVHSKGFKFGIYTDRGNLTCAGRPGSQDYEQMDANTYAEWGVDYLKEDSCYAPSDHDTAFAQYATMRDALNKTGRPIYFSLCGWNDWYAPKGWELGNSWRISGDVNHFLDMVTAIQINIPLSKYARPGGWNDPDMLVGSSEEAAVHLSPAQSRTQFNLWAVFAAPLLIGSNMLKMNSYDYETYSNVEVIAVDQDPLGKQGEQIWTNCDSSAFTSIRSRTLVKGQAVETGPVDYPECQQIWARPLADGSKAVVFVNYGSNNATVTCDAACLKTLSISSPSVRDLWLHQDLGVLSTFGFEIPASGGSRMFKVKEGKKEVARVPHSLSPATSALLHE